MEKDSSGVEILVQNYSEFSVLERTIWHYDCLESDPKPVAGLTIQKSNKILYDTSVRYSFKSYKILLALDMSPSIHYLQKGPHFVGVNLILEGLETILKVNSI